MMMKVVDDFCDIFATARFRKRDNYLIRSFWWGRGRLNKENTSSLLLTQRNRVSRT